MAALAQAAREVRANAGEKGRREAPVRLGGKARRRDVGSLAGSVRCEEPVLERAWPESLQRAVRASPYAVRWDEAWREPSAGSDQVAQAGPERRADGLRAAPPVAGNEGLPWR